MDPKPSDTEIVAACINVFCTPLARAIVAEMKVQGLVMARPEICVQHAQLDSKAFDDKKIEEIVLKHMRPTVAQIPCTGTCGTCVWCPKVTCNREGSPYHGKKVLPDGECGLYRAAETPKRAVPTEISQPKAYPKAICDTCRTQHTVNRKGGLYPHDVNGVSFRMGHGDRTKPCPGKPMKETI